MEFSTENTRLIRVLIVGANPIVGVGLKQVLRNEADIEVVGEISDPRDLQQVFDGPGTDVVLADALSTDEPTADMLRSAAASRTDIALLVMTTRANVHTHARLFRPGATGYVAKESEPAVLVAAVRHVAGRRLFIDQILAEAMFFAQNISESDPRKILSRREFEVLQQLAQGYSLSDISRALNLSIKTVSTHKTRFMQKLQLRSSADVMRFAMKNGIV
ncbi:Response regulator containing a CheY-like receiver domain and an HTH DNA-binding domain [Paraburkholderia kururiensis]|uniref:LuxR C-terminal-related transcriptional regulator n=1 Tax=Paraburkholderia kururiensis TaxID=984307 RepID=UPI0039A6F461